MTKKKIFLIDIDGVACAHAKAICKEISRDFSIIAKEKDVQTWNHSWSHSSGKISFIEAVNRYYPNEKFILEMEVTPGFYNFLKEIRKRGIEVIFASTRKHSPEATKEWVKNHFGHYEVVFITKKAELDFDYLVDDHPDEVIEGAKKGMAFLLSKPWNNNEETKNRLKKENNSIFVNNFSEIILHLEP